MKLVGPGPAGWEPEGGLAAVVDESPGNGEEPGSERLGHDHLVGGVATEFGGPADQVVGEHGVLEPGAVRVERSGAEMGKAAGFEVADGELDDSMRAVLAVERPGGSGKVGDERVVAPRGEQLALGSVVAGDATHDQASVSVDAFGDAASPSGYTMRCHALSTMALIAVWTGAR